MKVKKITIEIDDDEFGKLETFIPENHLTLMSTTLGVCEDIEFKTGMRTFRHNGKNAHMIVSLPSHLYPMIEGHLKDFQDLIKNLLNS